LPVHTAGTAGVSALTLTVNATPVPDVNGDVSSIVFSVSGAPGADASMILKHDKLQFSDGVAGVSNVRFMTFVGHQVTGLPIQMRATADAASTGGSLVTVTFDPPLNAQANNKDQNLNTPILVNMEATVLPSHRAGLITSGDPLYLAMPRLPDQSPFVTGNAIDSDTGVSVRQTYGTLFGQNQQGFVHDCLFGKALVADYAMSVIFPL